MRTAMYEEARLFFESIVRENRSVVRFVDSDYTFLNATLAPPLPLIFIAITLASVLGYLYWIYRGATDAERLYPYRPPLNLLALRVFGSPNLSDFLNLSDAWQWIATRQLLDGPDTAGHKAKDLLNYLSGRIDRSIKADATGPALPA